VIEFQANLIGTDGRSDREILQGGRHIGSEVQVTQRHDVLAAQVLSYDQFIRVVAELGGGCRAGVGIERGVDQTIGYADIAVEINVIGQRVSGRRRIARKRSIPRIDAGLHDGIGAVGVCHYDWDVWIDLDSVDNHRKVFDLGDVQIEGREIEFTIIGLIVWECIGCQKLEVIGQIKLQRRI
jgi:hypothetical protein